MEGAFREWGRGGRAGRGALGGGGGEVASWGGGGGAEVGFEGGAGGRVVASGVVDTSEAQPVKLSVGFGIGSRSTNQNRPFRKSHPPTRQKSDRVAILE